jgi:predicted DNA-binding transcriptional regulator YafY
MADQLLRHLECLQLVTTTPQTAADIHEKLKDIGFKTTRRTVERDLDTLSRKVGITCDDEQKPYRWYYSGEARRLVLPKLSATEALSFLLLKQLSSRILPTTIKDDLEVYFDNAAHALSESVSRNAIRDWPNKVRIVETSLPLQKPEINTDVQKEIYEALLRNKQAKISYLKPNELEAKAHTVNVLGLIEHGATVYIVVTYAGHEDLRLLALHRIRKAETLGTATVTPPGFTLDKYIESGGMGFGGDGRQIQLVLRFYDGAGYPFLETALSEDQTVLKNADGIIEIRATVRETARLEHWLLGFGRSIEVLEPPEYREKIKGIFAEASNRYQT